MDPLTSFFQAVKQISDGLTVVGMLLAFALVGAFLWWRDDIVLGRRHRAVVANKDYLIQEKDKEIQYYRDAFVTLYDTHAKLVDHISKKDVPNV